MKPEELIRHFGDVEKAAAGVGVTPCAVYHWLAGWGDFHRYARAILRSARHTN
ncbi:Cro/CI family transcriptional regulator [Klebsiella pneumoniae]|uniref:Cro/CI family transcriptional regulator n=1 Tax=Klebsiella pneumoniae TaxID=573 RepID=UPI001D0F1C94|nr:Cro/CI family transcriptional regulator [Klebsiella pneumoniae]